MLGPGPVDLSRVARTPIQASVTTYRESRVAGRSAAIFSCGRAAGAPVRGYGISDEVDDMDDTDQQPYDASVRSDVPHPVWNDQYIVLDLRAVKRAADDAAAADNDSTVLQQLTPLDDTEPLWECLRRPRPLSPCTRSCSVLFVSLLNCAHHRQTRAESEERPGGRGQ